MTSRVPGVVGRLAPTPSGHLHVGNVFSLMMAWLAARSRGGSVMLRIEDLDRDRCKPVYADKVRRDLELLGFTWDNEHVLRQSERDDAYREALGLLAERGEVYPCFCTRADLHAASAPHVGDQVLYTGACRNLSAEERQARSLRRNPAYRLHVPQASIRFEDRLQGRRSQDLARECGDFIVRRSDGIYAYQLAVCVDDLFQGVTQVVRGHDLLDSTPRQIYLRSLLDPDAGEVEWWHVPLLVDEGGRRLAKRERDQSLDGLLERFKSPEHFIGYLSRLVGISEFPDPITMEELLDVFTPDALKGEETITWRLPQEPA